MDSEFESAELTVSHSLMAHWLCPILSNWEAEVGHLSHDAQNRVLWRIGGFPLFIGSWLSGDELELRERLDLVGAAKGVTAAIPNLFAAGQPMENGYFMWRDLLLAHDLDAVTADVAIEILREFTLHSDERVQCAALHGLGHLRHPKRERIVDEFIALHPEAKDDPWILECRNGTVM